MDYNFETLNKSLIKLLEELKQFKNQKYYMDLNYNQNNTGIISENKKKLKEIHLHISELNILLPILNKEIDEEEQRKEEQRKEEQREEEQREEEQREKSIEETELYKNNLLSIIMKNIDLNLQIEINFFLKDLKKYNKYYYSKYIYLFEEFKKSNIYQKKIGEIKLISSSKNSKIYYIVDTDYEIKFSVDIPKNIDEINRNINFYAKNFLFNIDFICLYDCNFYYNEKEINKILISIQKKVEQINQKNLINNLNELKKYYMDIRKIIEYLYEKNIMMFNFNIANTFYDKEKNIYKITNFLDLMKITQTYKDKDLTNEEITNNIISRTSYNYSPYYSSEHIEACNANNNVYPKLTIIKQTSYTLNDIIYRQVFPKTRTKYFTYFQLLLSIIDLYIQNKHNDKKVIYKKCHPKTNISELANSQKDEISKFFEFELFDTFITSFYTQSCYFDYRKILENDTNEENKFPCWNFFNDEMKIIIDIIDNKLP